jgi:glycogen debranching enzyme
VSGRQVSILQGNTFVVSDEQGDIDASPAMPAGLFAWDTRYLSKWKLTIADQALRALSIDDLQYFETWFFLVPDTGTVYVDSRLSVIRRRYIADGFVEELEVLNHESEEVDLTVRIDVASDFADMFDIKNAQPKKGRLYTRIEPGRLVCGYERDTFRRESVIDIEPPAELDDGGITFRPKIEPHNTWSTALKVNAEVVSIAGQQVMLGVDRSKPDIEDDLAAWVRDAPELECDDPPLMATYRRSLVDLAALRFTPLTSGERSLPAAGLPWFMTMFGRDSIFTSLQALPFAPELAATTLHELAARQGSRIDDFRDEDPGRILHEMRYGESAAFEEQPHTPYFGNADATALFVVLLDEYERWTGDTEVVCGLQHEARAALAWIDDYADLNGTGYVSYRRRNEETGLENQCWKDSWDSISYRDGRLPGFPRTTCELQGYAYDAKIRGARLARLYWNDPEYADGLEKSAADLKHRFNRDFWVRDGRYFALAIDTDGTQVDALSSNIGHLLWSGIVDRSKAKAVVGHLMGRQLYSGWGVRTLAVGEERYNPIGYHTGTVWPFDNSFAAWGLRRYGYKKEAARVAADILDAASFFDGRLPEAFGGYERELTRYPVEYPTACSPQAWSTGTPLLLLRTMLGLEPTGEQLSVDPALPAGVGHLGLLDIPGRWGQMDVFGRGRIEERAKSSRRRTEKHKV